MAGHGLWAVCQASVILFLASLGNYSLVGLIVLGLAILAPLTLAGSLNLRTLLAIDSSRRLDIVAAIFVRSLMVSVSLMISLVTLFIVARDIGDALVASLVIATRLVDQVSDVAIGHYQRSASYHLIARSFAARGLSHSSTFFAVYVFTGSLTAAACLALIACAAAGYKFDIVSLLTRGREASSGDSKLAVLKSIGESIWTSPFPMLDSLHFNSLRFGVYVSASEHLLGLVGVAQTAFSPMQILITVLGYTHLARSRKCVLDGDVLGYRRNVHRGIFWGGSVATLFLFFVALVPDSVLDVIYRDFSSEGRQIMSVVAVAMIPWAVTGFNCQNLISSHRFFAYTINPVLGLVVFWCLAFVLFRSQDIVPLHAVCLAFFVSMSVRAVHAYACSIAQIGAEVD